MRYDHPTRSRKMHFNDFERNSQTILTWFNRKLKPEQLRIMFHQLKHIPAEAYADIVAGLISDSKFFPTINEIKNRWWQWREAHPEKIVAEPRVWCEDCRGEGLLYIHQHMAGPGDRAYREDPYQQVVRCGSCGNWKRHFSDDGPVPIYKRSELEARGYLVLPELRVDGPSQQVPRHQDVDSLVDRVGKRIPEMEGI
jgi:hypothetical protein